MIKTRSALLASSLPGLAAALAACGSPPEQKAPVNPAERATAYQARLLAMPEGARNGVFIRAIRDADQECQHVNASAPTTAAGGVPVWFAQCSDGATFTIAIRDGGVAQVLPEGNRAPLADGGNASTTGNTQ